MALTVAQLVFGIYLLFVLLVGVYAARFTEHTPADFYIADRSTGTVVLGLTLVATVLSASMMVDDLGESGAAGVLWDAVTEQLADPDAPRTPDLGGEDGTETVVADLRERL